MRNLFNSKKWGRQSHPEKLGLQSLRQCTPQQTQFGFSRTQVLFDVQLKRSQNCYGVDLFQQNSREGLLLVYWTKHSFGFLTQRQLHAMVMLIEYPWRCTRCAF